MNITEWDMLPDWILKHEVHLMRANGTDLELSIFIYNDTKNAQEIERTQDNEEVRL